MILVTGGSGLVGSHLLYALTHTEPHVVSSYRAPSGIDWVKKLFETMGGQEGLRRFERVEWKQCDITDYQEALALTRGVKTVFHCAATVSFNKSQAEAMIFNNVQGTGNMVDASLANQVEAFCHVSSIAALGNAKAGKEVDELCTIRKTKGLSAYGRSKFFSENEVWRGVEMGLRAVIVNPSVILGPTRWNTGSGVLFSTAAKGLPFYTLGLTGYVGVTDVVNAMRLLVEKEMWGQRFVLNAENVSHRQIFNLISHQMGTKPPRIRARKWMTTVAWVFAHLWAKLTGREPALTRDTAQSSHSTTRYSSKKIVGELGFAFQPLAEEIAFTSQVYKKMV